jgi:hypothetical protein
MPRLLAWPSQRMADVFFLTSADESPDPTHRAPVSDHSDSDTLQYDEPSCPGCDYRVFKRLGQAKDCAAWSLVSGHTLLEVFKPVEDDLNLGGEASR